MDSAEIAETTENAPEAVQKADEEVVVAEKIIVNAKDNDIVADQTEPVVQQTESSVVEISDDNEHNNKSVEEEVVLVEEKSDKTVLQPETELSWEKIASEITESDAVSEVNTTSGTFDVFVTEEVEPIESNSAEEGDPAAPQEETEPKQELTVIETENTTEIAAAAAPSDEKPEETVVVEEQAQAQAETSTEEAEIIQITELKGEEEPSTSSETIEYTVVEADDVETNEIIEKHLAQTHQSNNSGTETLLIINESDSVEGTSILADQGDSTSSYTEEVFILEEEDKLEEEEEDEAPAPPPKKIVKIKKQRGRKPTSEIPLHVLGRDITKPTEGVSNGGRTLPKPRLGVKVPYKNLTSQIVSKADIEKEIMDRFKSKQEQNAAASSDLMFARKLTQRLAKKLVPEKEKQAKSRAAKAGSSTAAASSGIKDDSDLIAILEGNDEEIPERKTNIKAAIIDDPEREKEIALKQLRELPNTPSSGVKTKVYRTRVIEEKKAVAPQPVAKQQPARVVVKVEEKKEAEMEPRLKTGMVVKTYTRKRKSSDAEQPAAKKASGMVVLPVIPKHEESSPSSTAYITKSSRVIKRKVIWDPDEAPLNKSPIKSPKQDTTATTVATPQKATAVTPAVLKKLENAPATTTPSSTTEKKTVVVVKKIIGKTSPSIKKPKRLTEVDKLLMDEGALNMLYDMKTETDDANNKKKQPKIKDFMTKTNAIKNDLQQTTAKDSPQKSLRKKESITTVSSSTPAKKVIIPASPKKETTTTTAAGAATPARKKSKDSVRSSIHSPPASPGFNSAEASRIIRRHSSSSFSSIDDEDGDNGEEVEERVTRKRAGEAAAAASAAKKRTKKNSETKNNSSGGGGAAATSKTNNNNTTEKKEDTSVGQYKTFTATKSNKLVTIKLYNSSGDCYLTELMLKELTKCLEDLGDDDDCNVVSITSSNSKVFCKGLDYRALYNEEESVRKKKANEFSTLIKEFLKCLLYFPKVLVAGVQGECFGLGVTMLPLFDMVVASDTSTFSTPYSKLGGVAEAGFLLTIPHVGNHGLASELLYTSQVLKADDCFRRGLVTRLCWPEKYEKDLSNLLADVASGSSQSLESTKLQVRQNIFESTEACLSKLGKVLVEHWTSPECQENFKKDAAAAE